MLTPDSQRKGGFGAFAERESERRREAADDAARIRGLEKAARPENSGTTVVAAPDAPEAERAHEAAGRTLPENESRR